MTDAHETFEAYFAREIAPALADLEAERRKAVTRHNIAVGVGAALGLVAFVWIASRGGPSPPAFIVAGIIVVLGVGVGQAMLALTARTVKDALVPRVAAFAGVTFSRKVSDPSAIHTFRKHGLVPSYDRSSFEDFFSGTRADCPFELFEAHLKQRHRDSKGRTHYTTCFRGQVLRVLVPVNFLGVTVVLRDAGIFNRLIKPERALERVRLVDPKFEKTFEVFSNDQVEARYLLSPDFMERLLALETMLKGKKARAAFADGELMIAIEGGNLFEAGSMFTPLADPARARKVWGEIESVHGVIDALLAARRQGAANG